MVDEKRTIDKYLSSPKEIPFNQRQYVWIYDNVTKLLNDIICKFTKVENNQERNYRFWHIGSFIILKRKDGSESIWDGQQRSHTISIILLCIKEYCIRKKIKDKIIKEINCLIFRNNDLLTDEEEKYQKNKSKECGTEIRIPIIKCVRGEDNDILALLFNSIIHNIEHYYYECDEEVMKCNVCKKKFIAKELKMKNHFKKTCIKKVIKSKILRTLYLDNYEKNYIVNFGILMNKIKQYFDDEFSGDIGMIKKFYNFIKCQVYFEVKIVYNSVLAADMYKSFNTTGLPLEGCDIIRNDLIRRFPDNLKEIYYDELENITEEMEFDVLDGIILICGIIEKKYTEYAKDEKNMVASNIFYKVICKDDSVKRIRKRFNEFKSIFNSIKNALKEIHENNEFQVLDIKDQSSWLFFKYILLPIFLNYRKLFNRVCEMVVGCFMKYVINKPNNIQQIIMRNIKNSGDIILTREKGSICILNLVNEIVNKIIKDAKVTDKSFLKNCNSEFKTNKKPQIILIYHASITNNNSVNIRQEKFHVDHINSLNHHKNKKSTHLLGNRTLLEAERNIKLKDKRFKHKRKSFKKSSISLTREIGKNKKWNDKLIDENTKKISTDVLEYANDRLELSEETENELEDSDAGSEDETENESEDESEDEFEDDSGDEFENKSGINSEDELLGNELDYKSNDESNDESDDDSDVSDDNSDTFDDESEDEKVIVKHRKKSRVKTKKRLAKGK